jgi:hypothetical protein
MAITKLPKKNEQVVNQIVEDNFILGAPDGALEKKSKAKGVFKGHKRQISLTISPELLDRLDALSETMGQGRAALINLAILQAVERGFDVKGELGK